MDPVGTALLNCNLHDIHIYLYIYIDIYIYISNISGQLILNLIVSAILGIGFPY